MISVTQTLPRASDDFRKGLCFLVQFRPLFLSMHFPFFLWPSSPSLVPRHWEVQSALQCGERGRLIMGSAPPPVSVWPGTCYLTLPSLMPLVCESEMENSTYLICSSKERMHEKCSVQCLVDLILLKPLFLASFSCLDIGILFRSNPLFLFLSFSQVEFNHRLSRGYLKGLVLLLLFCLVVLYWVPDSRIGKRL